MAGKRRVTNGIGDGAVAVMRFLPPTITIHVGETVTWVNRDSETPHTVTFGQEPPGGPEALAQPYGNPSAYNGTRPLNSGYLGINPPWVGTTFRVRFTKAGTYPYICGLHDELGMKGTVIVQPALGPGPGTPAELPDTGQSDGRGELGWLLVLGICCGLTGALIRRTGLLHR